MAGSLNKVTLIGNLGRDPEVRTFQNGGKVCNLRIATSENWKDKNTGERREKTEWHSISIFSEPLIRIAEQYLRKGSKVYVEGQLETRKWTDQNGNDRYTTEVAMRPYKSTLTMLDPKPRQDGQYNQPTNQPNQNNAPRSYDDGQRHPGPSYGYEGRGHQMDDDIPF